MEATLEDDLAVLLRACLHRMSAIEARYLEVCCLADPRTTLKAFAKENGLYQKEFSELRTRAMGTTPSGIVGEECLVDWRYLFTSVRSL
jgi:hypothetical protein